MIVLARRASAILYNLLRSRQDERPFLLPANICPIVPAVFLAAGQAFELIDIEEPWLQLHRQVSYERLRARPGGYAGVLYVRPYGSERDPDPFFKALKEIQSDLLVIDDKCLCRPDPDVESPSPAADVTLFSTGHAKYTDLDHGGFAQLNDALTYVHAAGEPVPDWLDLGEPGLSWNDYRRQVVLATQTADEQKQKLNAIYSEMLPAEIQLAPDLQRWRFNIRVPAAEELLASIFAADLFASRHYPALSPGLFPVAEHLHASIVNLFNDRYFDGERARKMVRVILRHLERTGHRA
jgi:hypothetical protein